MKAEITVCRCIGINSIGLTKGLVITTTASLLCALQLMAEPPTPLYHYHANTYTAEQGWKGDTGSLKKNNFTDNTKGRSLDYLRNETSSNTSTHRIWLPGQAFNLPATLNDYAVDEVVASFMYVTRSGTGHLELGIGNEDEHFVIGFYSRRADRNNIGLLVNGVEVAEVEEVPDVYKDSILDFALKLVKSGVDTVSIELYVNDLLVTEYSDESIPSWSSLAALDHLSQGTIDRYVGLSEFKIYAGEAFFPPEVAPITLDVSSLAADSLTIKAKVILSGGSAVTVRGALLTPVSENASPLLDTPGVIVVTDDETGLGNYTATFSNLDPLVTYAVRSYAQNAWGTC